LADILHGEDLASPCWEELKDPLVELLLKFYNAEDHGNDFVHALRTVIEILHSWRMHGAIDGQSLLNFFVDQMFVVFNEIKHKLLTKAIEKFNLLNSLLRSDSDGAPSGPGALS